MVKEKKSLSKRKEAEQNIHVVNQHFAPSMTFSFANLEGKLSVAGQDVVEIEKLLLLAVRVPAVAVFMQIDKPNKKNIETSKSIR